MVLNFSAAFGAQSRSVFDLAAAGGLALCACLRLGKLSVRRRNATKTRRTARAPIRERGEDAGRNSGSLLLTLEPGSHFAPWKIDAVVYAYARGKAELRVMAPAPQGDSANAEALAQPRRNHKLRGGCSVGCGVAIVAGSPARSGMMKADTFNLSADKRAFAQPMFACPLRLSPVMHVAVSCLMRTSRLVTRLKRQQNIAELFIVPRFPPGLLQTARLGPSGVSFIGGDFRKY